MEQLVTVLNVLRYLQAFTGEEVIGLCKHFHINQQKVQFCKGSKQKLTFIKKSIVSKQPIFDYHEKFTFLLENQLVCNYEKVQ